MDAHVVSRVDLPLGRWARAGGRGRGSGTALALEEREAETGAGPVDVLEEVAEGVGDGRERVGGWEDAVLALGAAVARGGGVGGHVTGVLVEAVPVENIWNVRTVMGGRIFLVGLF